MSDEYVKNSEMGLFCLVLLAIIFAGIYAMATLADKVDNLEREVARLSARKP